MSRSRRKPISTESFESLSREADAWGIKACVLAQQGADPTEVEAARARAAEAMDRMQDFIDRMRFCQYYKLVDIINVQRRTGKDPRESLEALRATIANERDNAEAPEIRRALRRLLPADQITLGLVPDARSPDSK